MISYKNENGNVKELAAQGSMKDLLAAIYSMLARRDKAAAEIFKVSMMMAVGDPESPVWQDLKPNCLSIVERRKKEET